MPLAPPSAAHRGGHSPAPPSGRRGADGAKETERQLLDDYTLGEELGQGAFGVVYACSRRNSNNDFRAVKMVDKVETPVKEIKREAEILNTVNHRNVIRFHEVYYEKCFVCIVMDRYQGGDLIAGMQHHWENQGRIPFLEVKHIKRQCAIALQVLHEKGVVHRDVKGDNYLLDRINILDPECLVVLTDFGTAIRCKVDERVRGLVGTKTYWSPEFYANDYGQKVDVWAFGVIVYGLLEGRFPFKDEEAVKLRKPKLHNDLPAACVDFVRSLLKKEDGRRSDAATAVDHAWIKEEKAQESDQTEDRSTPRGDKEEWSRDAKQRLNEGGPQAANRNRRYELVDRLEDAKKQKGDEALHFLNPCWEIAFKHEKKTVTFEWWPKKRIEEIGLWSPTLGKDVSGSGNEDVSSFEAIDTFALLDRESVETMLSDHGIDMNCFGRGQAKTFQQFLAEIRSGATRLMLDAAEYKKMVRVVDVVLLRVSYQTKTGEKRYMVEVSEKFADGRTRGDLNRLPGTKREPHENVKRVIARILRDMLGMQDCKVLCDFKAKESFEDEQESPSYPGVRTVYRREVIEGQVSTTDAAALRRIGAEGNANYNFEDSTKNTKYLTWMTEANCKSLTPPVRIHYPKSSSQVSGLVSAPISINEQALSVYLASNGVNVAQFDGESGRKTLTGFAAELSNSEASLARDARGKILRVVDVVALNLTKVNTQDMLVQAKETFSDGQIKAVPRLPGSKKGESENQFNTAYRVLDRLLKIDENYVHIDGEKVRIIEEVKDSPSYPGMQTLYRRRLISGEVVSTAHPPSEAAHQSH
eukprot:TRINITY_DN2817_c0_g1_i3.p1 TRINITY_DN2817_c0_g1~~TRINITY_DN2817_c0_g1_i3.p1  ORF type:complete len:810 (-),score=160.25 TRINITY_DN2817_c0_g1_i3:5-2434(-)